MNLLLAPLLWLACFGGSLPGTTVRVERMPVEARGELEVVPFVEPDDCPADAALADCLPRVDRAAGEVQVAFRVRDETGAPRPLPRLGRSLRLSHSDGLVPDDAVDLVPHDPTRAAQLYVVLIDASGSMREPAEGGRPESRMDRVRRALLRRDVVDAFFPRGVDTGVVLLTFTEGRPLRVGAPGVVTRPVEFRQRVLHELAPRGGYTHLYDAVRYAMGPLLEAGDVASWIQDHRPEISVVVLTDGFNNERPDDTCGDNAPRLARTLAAIRASRRDRARGLRISLTTVGLGTGFRRNLAEPRPGAVRVGPRRLCGPHAERRIDGDLELRGIDNASLAWLAAAGGGRSYVSRRASGLAEAFRAAAARRYAWFQARYRVDPLHLGRTFETRIQLLAPYHAEGGLLFRPSGWIDGPPGRPGADGWTRPAPLSAVAALVLPLLAGPLVLLFVGAAAGGIRRARDG